MSGMTLAGKEDVTLFGLGEKGSISFSLPRSKSIDNTLVMEPLLLSLLRSVVKGKMNSLGPFPNEALVNWSIRMGLGPIVYETVLAASTPTSRPLAVQLLVSELAAKVAYQRRTRAFEQIMDACSVSEISLIPLKGISICDEYYPKPHWRPMVDIDFLVSNEDLGQTENTLRNLGYQQGSPYPLEFYHAHHHSMPFRHPSTGVVVEVHTALFPDSSSLSVASAFQPSNIASHLRLAELHGNTIYRLSSELELVYLSCHAVAEKRIFTSLIPFLDIAFLLRQVGQDLNWGTLLAWLENRTVSAYVCIMLSYLKKHRLTDLPRPVDVALAVANRRLGKFALHVIHRGIDRHAASGHSMDDVLGRDNRFIIWDTLIAPRAPLLNLLLVPWNLAFPPSNPERFKILFQLSRLRSALCRARLKRERDPFLSGRKG